MNKKVLIVTEDQKAAAAAREALADCQVETVAGVEAAFARLRSFLPQLVIIDHDLKGVDGLQFFRQLKLAWPAGRIIMIATDNDIPLAVSATKLGIADFLRKPLDGKLLLAAVEKNLHPAERAVKPPAKLAWLQGGSRALRELFQQIKEAAAAPRNLIISAEPGINKKELAAFIHEEGPKSRRKFIALELASFHREDQEAAFWASVQELLSPGRAGSLPIEEDRCGTLYLEGIATLEESFRLSILEFFKTRQENLDREALVLIGLEHPFAGQLPSGYGQLIVPPLRERKEDLNLLLTALLAGQAARYNKPVAGFTGPALELLTLYDYPGNYRELECIVEYAVGAAEGALIGLKELPLDERWVKTAAGTGARLTGRDRPGELKLAEEKALYLALLAKFNNDVPAVARRLDIPRSTLQARLEELGCHPAD